VLGARRGVTGREQVRSDMRSMHQLARTALKIEGVKRLREVSRGGTAAALHLLAGELGVCARLRDKSLPVQARTKEILLEEGVNPLFATAAGVMIAAASPGAAQTLLTQWHRVDGGRGAVEIGDVQLVPRGEVQLILRDGTGQPLNLPRHNLPERLG
ncbi:hypothetical protein GF324_11495, partial [bacterium]|nr:hypothetical protein [bacterium]